MRTTLTLDPDVAVLLKRLRRAGRGKLKELVNAALREGLARMTRPSPPRSAYRVRPMFVGRSRIGSLDCVSEALSVGEGEGFR
jgi:hypothetical protein